MALLKWFGALLLLALAATGTAQASMLKPMQKPIQEPMQAGANELAQWPQWVFAPTSDYPDTHLYGLGFGASKSAARQHALAEVVLQISTDVQVLQRSVMARAKSNDAVTVRDDFEQRSAIEALGVKVESIEEQRTAALQSPDGIEFAVLLAVPKEAIISSLHDQVRPFESLAFPYDDETAQLLWALQYRQQILDACYGGPRWRPTYAAHAAGAIAARCAKCVASCRRTRDCRPHLNAISWWLKRAAAQCRKRSFVGAFDAEKANGQQRQSVF